MPFYLFLSSWSQQHTIFKKCIRIFLSACTSFNRKKYGRMNLNLIPLLEFKSHPKRPQCEHLWNWLWNFSLYIRKIIYWYTSQYVRGIGQVCSRTAALIDFTFHILSESFFHSFFRKNQRIFSIFDYLPNNVIIFTHSGNNTKTIHKIIRLWAFSRLIVGNFRVFGYSIPDLLSWLKSKHCHGTLHLFMGEEFI